MEEINVDGICQMSSTNPVRNNILTMMDGFGIGIFKKK